MGLPPTGDGQLITVVAAGAIPVAGAAAAGAKGFSLTNVTKK
jgi:hypothetical protein